MFVPFFVTPMEENELKIYKIISSSLVLYQNDNAFFIKMMENLYRSKDERIKIYNIIHGIRIFGELIENQNLDEANESLKSLIIKLRYYLSLNNTEFSSLIQQISAIRVESWEFNIKAFQKQLYFCTFLIIQEKVNSLFRKKGKFISLK
jgi:hypothetical protein